MSVWELIYTHWMAFGFADDDVYYDQHEFYLALVLDCELLHYSDTGIKLDTWQGCGDLSSSSVYWVCK